MKIKASVYMDNHPPISTLEHGVKAQSTRRNTQQHMHSPPAAVPAKKRKELSLDPKFGITLNMECSAYHCFAEAQIELEEGIAL
nr:zinc finger BED domain-containing protein RICESLEEPER 2-like [Ipomoea batatas]